jgi:hypothetical protein
MDKEKVREAIEVIKGYRRLDEYMNNTERLPYCDMAIEALEKQLPKKPRENKIRGNCLLAEMMNERQNTSC